MQPCKDCKNRHFKCHAKCKLYDEFLIKLKKEKEQIKKCREYDRFFWDGVYSGNKSR